MKIIQGESGQTILEYALIMAVFVLLIISIIPSFATSINNVFNEIKNSLDAAPPSS